MRDEDGDGWGSVDVSANVIEGNCDDTDPYVIWALG